MKNSKGFTLIELLAVLILISIIVVISMPKILNVIEQSKIKAYEQSSNSISDAAKFKQNSEFYENGEFTSDYSFAGGNYADKSEKLPFKGDTPYSGMLHLNKSGETALAFLFKDNKNYYCVTKNYNDKKSSGTKIKTGNDCSITLPEGLVLSAEMDEIEEFVQVDDPNPGVICGDEKEENYSGVNECHIKSVEDFVELSVLVNSGKDFNGKNVVLDNDIDFNNDLSYINSNNNFGDFNEDGVTESIKKEVSESYGFQPIGNNTKNFKGVFLGNNNKIKGIYINRTEQDYVGLFGFVSGNIKNVSIESANVKGKNYVGTLAGKLSGINSNGFTVNNLNVSGSGSIGSIFGDAPKVLSIYAENVNVKGDTSVGGIIGNGGYSKYSDSVIIKNSTVTGTTNTKMISGGQYGSVKNYLAVNVKLNDEDVSNSTLEMIEDINGLEAAGIDTYVGGDNDSDGFYFDYNKKNKIIITNTEDNPIIGLTIGTGTKIDPYIISSEEDWKKATAMINNTTYYFKLTKDLDFSNKKFYMLGSKTIQFKGILDGNNKKISSVILDLEKSSYIGLSGSINGGIIKNINIDKFNIKADTYVGALAGEQRTDANAPVNVTNSNVSGNSHVGGVYGAARLVSYVVTDNINVEGTTSVGGIVGEGGYSKYTSNTIMKNSKVTGTSAAKAISGGQYGSSKNYLLLNVKLNDEDVSNSTLEMLEDINGLEAAGIDTYIGGDNDGSGYYFDYNDQNKIVIKNTEDNPIVQLENGTGTKIDPYLISSEEDWKKATSMISNTIYYFKLTKDLDFSNKKFYMFGSKTTPFNGILDGNNKKISSVTLNLEKSSYIGLSGYASNGVIKNINIDKFIVKGDSYVGTLTGEQRVDINASVNVTNSNVSGNSYVGGVYGAARTLSYVTIDNVNVKGDTSVGGIVGNVGSSKYTSNTVMKNSMVTGTTYTKAINGGQYGSSRNYLLLNIKLNNEDVSNSTTDTINDINTYEVAGIDTYIGGDNDNTGYYFDYNDQNKIVIKNTEDNPIVQLENGTGTKENPYLISNEEDWKKASATSTTSDTYFKLTKDLDFSNKKFYMLGSKNNEFKGTLDGNGKKISNLSINVPKVAGFDYVGIIGKGGSAYGINLDNIKVTGYNYVGALFGSTRGTVRDIYASNLNISGNNYIGGIGGDINTNSPRPTSMIISANVEGNSYVGITTGSSYLGIEQIAIIGGSIKGSSYVGRLSGNTVSWNDTYALETIPNGNGGKDCWKTIPSDANLSDLSIYKNMNIDTSLTGDTDGVGYYFDVDKNGNIFVTK